jgi:arginase
VFFSFFLNECFTDMSSLGRRGIHFLHKLNSASVPTDLLEKGQNRVIDASLTLIRERAKLKVYVGFC